MKKFIYLLLTSITGYTAQAQNNVGINLTNPAYPLTVQGVVTTGKSITAKNGSIELGFYNDSTFAYIQTWTPHDLNFATNNGSGKITIQNATGFVGINTTAPTAQLDINGTLRIRTGGGAGKVLTSDASGNATWQTPTAPTTQGVGFRAVLTSDVSRPAGNYSLINYTEDYDNVASFNAVTGVFTAPSAGFYHFTSNIGWNYISGSASVVFVTRLVVEFAGGGNDYIAQSGFPVNTVNLYGNNFITSGDYKLNAGDKVHVDVSHNYGSNITLNSSGSSQTTFSGFKVF